MKARKRKGNGTRDKAVVVVSCFVSMLTSSNQIDEDECSNDWDDVNRLLALEVNSLSLYLRGRNIILDKRT